MQSDGESEDGFVAGVFSYDAYEVDASAGEVRYHYSHRDGRSGVALARFSTSLALPLPAGELPAGAHAAAFQAGLASLPWLWLGMPTRRVAVRAGALDDAACAFWARAYNAALGEFFQAHGLPYPDALTVECDATSRPLSPRGAPGGVDAPPPAPPSHRNGRPRRVLVPLGGGKDSLTVWEMLRSVPSAEMDHSASTWFYLEDEPGEFAANWRYAALVAASGAAVPALVACHRWRCPRWEAARVRSFTPCGHPWALLVAFSSALVAVLHGFDAVVVGNERSAGEGNGSYRGAEVNHQHDKALPFELVCAAHLHRSVSPRLRYFSALAHLWEVQVAHRFCSQPVAARYLRLFASCNEAASRPGGAPPSRACARCAKCLFVALLLAAFCDDPRDAWTYAGDDLLQNAALAPLLGELLGRDGAAKPMDCVGTPREVALCVARARDAYARAGLPLPALLADARAEEDDAEGRRHEAMLHAADGEHALPRWAAAACGADPARYVGPPESDDEHE